MDTSIQDIGTAVADALKANVKDGLAAVEHALTAQEQKDLLDTTARFGRLKAQAWCGMDVTADMADTISVLARYKDILAQVAREVEKRAIETDLLALGKWLLGALVKAII